MIRYVTPVCAALVAAAAFVGTSNEANAYCPGCGPVAPVYHYRTINRFMSRTQYHDVRRTNYVLKIRPIYNITRIRPIVQVHHVTRVHHYTVPVIRNVSVPSVQYMPTQYVSSSSVQNIYHGCGCGGY